MSTSHLEREYHCWDDCDMQGCPGHTATLDFQSVSDWFQFSDGKGHEIGFHPTELEALLNMVKELAGWRVEAASVLDTLKESE